MHLYPTENKYPRTNANPNPSQAHGISRLRATKVAPPAFGRDSRRNLCQPNRAAANPATPSHPRPPSPPPPRTAPAANWVRRFWKHLILKYLMASFVQQSYVVPIRCNAQLSPKNPHHQHNQPRRATLAQLQSEAWTDSKSCAAATPRPSRAAAKTAATASTRRASSPPASASNCSSTKAPS